MKIIKTVDKPSIRTDILINIAILDFTIISDYIGKYLVCNKNKKEKHLNRFPSSILFIINANKQQIKNKNYVRDFWDYVSSKHINKICLLIRSLRNYQFNLTSINKINHKGLLSIF